MRTRTILSCSCVVAALVLAAPAPAGATSLREALAIAYETNPELIAARANLRAIDEQVNQARAGMRPQIDAGVSYDLETSNSQLNGHRNRDPFTATVNATQALYDGGRTYNSVLGRIADVSAARARLVQLEQQVLLDVITAYLDILRDRQFVTLARNNVRVISEQLRASQDRFEVGEVTRTDVSQAEARLAESRANLATAQAQLARSEQNYRQVVGQAPVGLDERTAMPKLPATIEEAVTIALENHPAIIARRFDETSARRDVRTAVGALLPTVSLVAEAGYSDNIAFINDDGFRSNDTTTGAIGVRAQIPIFQGGAEYSRIRQAQERASAARADLSVEARERRRQAEAAWTELLSARANIAAGREQVRAAELAFQGVREEAIVGSRTTLDVLDAEQELLDARSRLVETTRNEMVAAYSLLATIGALTLADLGIEAAAYDPEASYAENNARWAGYDATDDTVWEALWRP